MKVLYKTSSGNDSCTLYHLRNLLMRQAVAKEIKGDPTACEEFFTLILEGHIVSLAMSSFALPSLEADANSPVFSKENFLNASPLKRKEIFMSSVKTLVSNNIYKHIIEQKDDADRVLIYGRELFTCTWGCCSSNFLMVFERETVQESLDVGGIFYWSLKPPIRTNTQYKQQPF